MAAGSGSRQDSAQSEFLARFEGQSRSDQERWLERERLTAAVAVLQKLCLVPAEFEISQDAATKESHEAPEQKVLLALHASASTCILAGPALNAWTLYPSQACRVRDWVDVLVHAREVNLARAALREEGFSPVPEATGRNESAQAWRHARDSSCPGVKLRWDFCDHPLLSRRFSIAGLLAKSVILDQPISGIRGLGPAHAVLFGALRWVDAVRERFRLIDLLDQDLRWRSLDREQVADLALLARQRGVAGILAEHLELTARTFGTPIPEELRRSLRQTGKHERSVSLLGARRGRLRYHGLGVVYGHGLRARWRHALSLFVPDRIGWP